MNSIRPEQQIFQESALVAEEPAEHTRRTILLVEDEDFIREVISEVLLSAGYVVLRARTAAEAMRLFVRNGERLHLLLTDVVLPGRSGQVLARELKIISPELKTIFISGYPKNEIGEHVQPEPGTFFLPKPFSVEMLLGIVEAALAGRETAPAGEKVPKRA